MHIRDDIFTYEIELENYHLVNTIPHSRHTRVAIIYTREELRKKIILEKKQ